MAAGVRFNGTGICGLSNTTTGDIPSISDHTVCFFVQQVNATPSGVIWEMDDGTAGFGHEIVVDVAGTTFGYVKSGDAPFDITGELFAANAWYFMCLQVAGSTTTFYWKKLGESVCKSGSVASATTFTPTGIWIGSERDGFGVDARVAGLKLWSGKTLTQAEIEAESEQLWPVRTQDLFAYWQLDGITSTTAQWSQAGRGIKLSPNTANASQTVGPPIAEYVPRFARSRRSYILPLVTTHGTAGDNTARANTAGGDTLRDESLGTPGQTAEVKIQVMRPMLGRMGVDDGSSSPLFVADVRTLAVLDVWADQQIARTAALRNLRDVIRGTRTGSPPAFVDDAIRAVSFDPSQLAGLAFWLSSDVGITQASGTVSAWNDRSGVGDSNKNTSQATGANQPFYNATDADYAGAPSVSGDSVSNRWLEAVGAWATPLAQPCTWFLAGKSTLAGGFLFGGDDAGAAPYQSGGNDGLGHWVVGTSAASFATTASAATAAVVCIVFNGASSALYITDSQTANTTGTVGSDAMARFVFGTIIAGGTPAAQFGGSAAELFAVSGAANATTRQSAMKYLGARYGLAAT